MSWRGTLVLAALAALAGVLYFLSAEDVRVAIPDSTLLGEPRYVDPSKPVKHLLHFDPAAVSKILLTRDDREVSVRRAGGEWKDVTDSRKLDDFLNAMKEFAELTTIEGGTANLADYGLLTPERRVVLELTGAPAITLAVGDRNPAGTAAYARVDDGPVLLVGALVIWELDKAFNAVDGTPGHPWKAQG